MAAYSENRHKNIRNFYAMKAWREHITQQMEKNSEAFSKYSDLLYDINLLEYSSIFLLQNI